MDWIFQLRFYSKFNRAGVLDFYLGLYSSSLPIFFTSFFYSPYGTDSFFSGFSSFFSTGCCWSYLFSAGFYSSFFSSTLFSY